jgi:tyrosine-protein kinase
MEGPQITYQTADEPGRSSFEAIGRAIRRGGLFVVLAAIGGALIAFAISKNLAPEYQATAQIYLTPASASSNVFQDVVLGQNLARSYVPLATADTVLGPAMDKVGWRDLNSFRDRTTVAQVKDTAVITVSFHDGDPQRAAAAANAIANSFIEQSVALQLNLQAKTAEQLDQQIAVVQKDIIALDAQIASLRAALAQPATPANAAARADQQQQLAQLDASRTSKSQTLANLVRAASDIRLAMTRGENSFSLWQPAKAPTEPVSPRIPANTLVGGLAAGLIAILIVAIVVYLDDRMADLDDLRARLRIPALGEVSRAKTQAGKLFVRDEPKSLEAEDFRAIRTNIAMANVDKRPQTILVTSALPLEGKSVVSANLALAFAQAGTPTILIDADLRRPSQHKLFKIRADVGLTDLLEGSAEATALPGARVAPNLIVVPSGSLPTNPAEILSSEKMTSLLGQITQMAPGTVVIVDSSPILAVTDAAALGSKVDGAVLVVDAGRTHAKSANRAIASLRAVHATILGAVLNKVMVPQTSYYYGDEVKRDREAPRVAAPEQPTR